MVRLYEEANNKGFYVGEALYKQLRFFANESQFMDSAILKKIKIYQYCKSSNTPPYPTLHDTPANFIDDYLEMEGEFKLIEALMKRDKENAK